MTTKTVRIDLGEGRTLDVEPNLPVGALAPPPDDPRLPFVAALVNCDVSSLSYPLTVNATVRFLTMADSDGWRVYRRSLCFLLAKAVRDAVPEGSFFVEHSFGLGIYCSFHTHGGNGEGIDAPTLDRIGARMRTLVDADLPIERIKVGYCDAVAAFRASAQNDKLNLLHHRNPPRIVMHRLDGFSDLAHGPLVPSTGALDRFALIRYPPGFVLHLPDRTDPLTIPPFEDQPHLFRIFREHKEWGRILGVSTAGRLNEIIAEGGLDDFIRTAEALHEKKLAKIADMIAEDHRETRLVLIAGPSCSGKTTFARRLATHLKVNGLQPVTIGTDDYFVGDEGNPLDEEGRPDYEHIEAVDLPLFNRHLAELVAGREIERPRFSFAAKRRDALGHKIGLGPDQILIIEGIHGLNPRLTAEVPAHKKFKIYVSALTQLGVDANNRISTTDDRLIRRLVRDHRFRGHAALATLCQWPSVRRGEKRWIFPYQKEADATFNSALDYELAVLKPLVEPLLMQIKPDQAEYAEARRLSEFLLNFLAVADASAVPGTSILREYIGGSTLSYGP